MKKIKEFIKSHKKAILIFSSIILILVTVILIIFLVLGSRNEEKELKKELEIMGREFYEDYYYDSLGTNEDARKETLMKYSRIGFKIDLDNLVRYYGDSNKLETFINKEKEEACNKTNTKVIIYPKENYGVTDYDIEVILDCGFEK